MNSDPLASFWESPELVPVAELPEIQLLEVSDILGDRYEIIRYLGKGASFQAYKGKDLLSKKPVAIKVFDSDPSNHEKICREIRSRSARLSQLQHEALVSVLDHETDELPCLIMDYVEGNILEELILDESVSRETMISIIKSCSQVTEYLHSNKIVHKSINTSKVLISDAGEVFLTDTALSDLVMKQWDQNTDMELSKAFRSPELVSGQKPDHRADIFSLGVTFFRMLTGKIPGEGPSALWTIETGISPACDEVLSTAMQANRKRRYGSVAEFCEDLLVALNAGQGTKVTEFIEEEAPVPVSDIETNQETSEQTPLAKPDKKPGFWSMLRSFIF